MTISSSENIERYNPDPSIGLLEDQVKKRVDQGFLNYNTNVQTKSIKKIISDNVLTLFNFLNLFLALALLYVGSYKNMLFLGVVFSNVVIGIFQEINAKKTIDKLSIVSATKVNVIREKKQQRICVEEVVLDDIIQFEQGNQIISDCIIVSGECDVNESLITGESDSVHKNVGDMLLSGSYVVSGKCKARVEHVAEDNYASKISQEAKGSRKINSQIMSTFKKIILIVSILIVPIGGLLFANQIHISDSTLENAVVQTVAAVIGMIPEGLILLTSSVLAVSVVRLSKQNVLVQELYCIESLARVDVLCLDKTGTITEGTMEVSGIEPVNGFSTNEIECVMSNIMIALEDCNPTFQAMQQKFKEPKMKRIEKTYLFSSEKKWSGVTFKDDYSYVIGAAEFILSSDEYSLFAGDIEKFSEENRVITLVRTKESLDSTPFLSVEVMGFILLKDRIRKTAKDTLKFFAEQDVDLKVISGDSVHTVASISKRAGLKNADKFVDATTLTSDDLISDAVEKYTVFGRVTPEQKKKIVLALKEKGHTVAMTGDGVNDVLALKESDCSVAMASGSDAARNVSQLVLLNSNFESMIKVVKEGRRSINNIQRSSSLFLVKTIYSAMLALLFLFAKQPYPFMPIQLTLVSVLTIGIPSFILALEPNNERVKGNFFRNISSRAVPGALTIVLDIFLVMIAKNIFGFSIAEYSTCCVMLAGITGFMLIYKICCPFNSLRRILLLSLCVTFVIGVTLLRRLFSLCVLNINLIFILCIIALVSLFVLKFLLKIFSESM